MSDGDHYRMDCPDCDDGGRVVERPEAGYAYCLDCGERGFWGEDETQWWRDDPESDWYVLNDDA